MPDPVLLLVKNGDAYCKVGCFMAYMGAAVLDVIDSAVPRMHFGEAWSSMARLIGTCHDIVGGNKGLNVVNIETDLPPSHHKEDGGWELISYGGAGVVVYDCTTGVVECHAGYLEKHKDNGTCIGVPNK